MKQADKQRHKFDLLILHTSKRILLPNAIKPSIVHTDTLWLQYCLFPYTLKSIAKSKPYEKNFSMRQNVNVFHAFTGI